MSKHLEDLRYLQGQPHPKANDARTTDASQPWAGGAVFGWRPGHCGTALPQGMLANGSGLMIEPL